MVMKEEQHHNQVAQKVIVLVLQGTDEEQVSEGRINHPRGVLSTWGLYKDATSIASGTLFVKIICEVGRI